MISGQLRSANFTWTSGDILHNFAATFFGSDDPPTPAGCIIEFLFKEIMRQGYGLDVFMYIQSSAHNKNNIEWDGKPYDYIPSPGDLNGCKIFSDNEVFRGTNNHFFCLVENEIQLMNAFIRNFLSVFNSSGAYLNISFDSFNIARLKSLSRINDSGMNLMVACFTPFFFKYADINCLSFFNSSCAQVILL